MQTTEDHTTTESVGDDLRSRVVLPVLLPVAVLGAMAVFVGTIAYALLNSSRGLAVVVAGVMATGLMVAMALASAIDERDMTTPKKAIILATAVLPLIAGVLIAASGAVPAEQRPINAEPPLLAPEGAVMAAENSTSFCEVAEDGESCAGDTATYDLPAQPESDVFAFQFVNNQSGVEHNVQLFTNDGGEQGEPVFTQDVGGAGQNAVTIGGGDSIIYQVDVESTDAEFEPGAEFYYNCVIHPVMAGVMTLTEPDA